MDSSKELTDRPLRLEGPSWRDMKGSAGSTHGATWLLLLYVAPLMVAVKNVPTHASDHLSTPHPALSALTRSLRGPGEGEML